MPLAFVANFGIPILLGYLCGESFSVLWHGNIYRYLIMLHLVWTVNSVAHMYGDKPYDKNISPTDSWYVGFGALGEGEDKV
jgi:stearoyl-CoA desaturase (delta-9 desaturase)